jgi:DHA1 family multidrug resistance protein-like MFS transporter
MSLRIAILLMSALAVVSDAVLIAFYPQFFAQRYGVTGAFHVGAYIAAISIAVMATLPLWARVARRVDTLRLLMWTQCAAGCLCALSAWADSVALYWALSLAMFMCKSSYLLMFPTLMRLEKPASHGMLIGLLSVLVHLGGIAGAAAGGWLLQQVGPVACIGLMAAGDFAQMAICIHLVASGKAPATAPAARGAEAPRWGATAGVLQLGIVMLVFDFSAYLTRPFFSVYWERLSGSGPALTGLVFALPGIVALFALAANKRAQDRGMKALDHTLANLALGTAGLLLQAAPSVWLVVAGRCLYGWALFQVVVKLELSLFRISTPDAYAGHYSVANALQNLGVLLSSFAAGALVARHDIAVTFLIGAAGFVATALLDRLTVRVDRLRPVPPLHDPRRELPHAA